MLSMIFIWNSSKLKWFLEMEENEEKVQLVSVFLGGSAYFYCFHDLLRHLLFFPFFMVLVLLTDVNPG